MKLTNEQTAIAVGIVVAGFLVWRAGSAIVDAVPKVLDQTTDVVAGTLTGNNAVTKSARTNAYEGAGVLGTLGAATDNISGGALSTFGEWLGGKTYELFN